MDDGAELFDSACQCDLALLHLVEAFEHLLPQFGR